MPKRLREAFAIAIVACVAAGVPAMAQQSKDTIRLTIIDPFNTLDSYHFPANEVGQYTRAMYGRLVVYDENSGKLLPELAKSWTRIDPTTVELELRDDLVFSSGNKFSAEDVRYTIAYITDPKLKIRFKGRYTWIKEVEVLDPYRIRIHAKAPRADDLMILAYRIQIYDAGVHSKLKQKSDYGSVSASTTGVYKMVWIDRNKGVYLQRHDAAIGKFPHRRAPIKFIRGIPIPDRQTQIASLLTGKVDVVRNPTPDTLKQLARDTNLDITAIPTRFLTYITLDAAGRSDSKVFTDLRVRQAFIKAIDREKLINAFMPGADIAIRPDAVCFKDNIACAYTTKPLGYDPEGAKRLLAEAGYPNGFDLELGAFAPLKELAAATAGELRKVGIRATVQPMPLPVYTKRRGAGELTALLARYPTFAQPNTANIMNFFFGANRDYSKDPIIQAARKKGTSVLDLAERTKVYQKAMDRVNEMSYIMPFSEQPNVYAHGKNLEIKLGLTSITETRPTDYFWK